MSNRPKDKRFIAAMVIDSTGSGLWIPFSIIYFVYGKAIPLPLAGTALTVGSLIALGVGGLAVGTLTDRLGSFPAAALSSLVRACVFPLYIVAGNVVAISAVAAVVSFGDRLFWASHGGVVAAFCPDTAGRMQLFATLNRVRNIGMGLGALTVTVCAAAEGVRSPVLYAIILLLNAVSFAVAAYLVFALRHRENRAYRVGVAAVPAERVSGATQHTRFTYRDVLTDHSFVFYTIVNIVFALSANSFSSALPIFLLEHSGMPPWMPGILYLTVCVTLLALKPVVNSLVSRYDPLRLRRASAWLCAGYFAALPLVPELGVTGGFTLMIFLVMVFALGEAVQAAVMTAIVLEFAPEAARGRYNAFFQLSWGSAGAAGPGIFAWGLTASPVGLWSVMAALVATAGVAVGRIRVPERTG